MELATNYMFLHFRYLLFNQQEPDGQDETIIPIDYEKSGQIVDDDLHEILVAGLPEGVRLTAIMDCCHSGSVFDLPFTVRRIPNASLLPSLESAFSHFLFSCCMHTKYTTDGNLAIQEVDNRKAAIDAAIAAGMAYFKGNKKSALNSGIQAVTLFLQDPQKPDEEARQRQIKIRSAVADVIQFSGCRDNQTSADGMSCSSKSFLWSFNRVCCR